MTNREDLFKRLDDLPTCRTRWDDLLDDLLEIIDDLSEHGIGFINDLEDKREEFGRMPMLSERQREYLEQLHERYT